MIATTTNNAEGKVVVAYRGTIFGEIITRIHALKGLEAELRNIFGSRLKNCKNELMSAEEEALAEMAERAKALGVDATIGVKMDYEVLGGDNGMLMVTCSETAVSTR